MRPIATHNTSSQKPVVVNDNPIRIAESAKNASPPSPRGWKENGPPACPPARDGVLGLVLLHEAEHRVGHDDEDDHQRVDGQPSGAVGDPGDDGDDDGREQQVDQRVRELPQQPLPGRVLGGAPQLVGAVALQSRRGLGCREPKLWINRGRGGDRFPQAWCMPVPT